MVPESSLSCPEEPATGPCPQPDASSSHLRPFSFDAFRLGVIYIYIYIYIYTYTYIYVCVCVCVCVPSVLTFRNSALLTLYSDWFHIVSRRKSVVALNISACVILIMEKPCVL
jgi:hypothetical protein